VALAAAAIENFKGVKPTGVHRGHVSHAQDEDLGRRFKGIENVLEAVGDAEEEGPVDFVNLDALYRLRTCRRSSTLPGSKVVGDPIDEAVDFFI
jgi:hypothetical protein